MSRSVGKRWRAGLAAAAFAVCLLPLTPNAGLAATGSAWAAPAPARKPAAPPIPGTRSPEALAAPDAPAAGLGRIPDAGARGVADMPPVVPEALPGTEFPAIPAPPPEIAAGSTTPEPGPPVPGSDALPDPVAPIPEPGFMAAVPPAPGTGPSANVAPGRDPGPQPSPAYPIEIPGGDSFRVVFADGDGDVIAPRDRELLTGIAARMARDQTARLQVRAYAAGNEDTAREARRLSLLRAVNVREYLVGQGIRSTRIDVRALGANAPDGPADRVDLVLVN
ncbi:MAG TPA: OmpA family protein [Arenibaculum sp.]|nr:OmpA family protein [Arenibaculum sp.]